MKKLMIAAAAAFCGTVFGLESANVVGYTTKTIPAGKYMMVAVQFDTTENTEMNVDQAIKVNKAGKAWASATDETCIPNWFANAPCIKIPKGTVDKGYTDLYYAKDACDADDDWALKPGWADESGMMVKNVTIPEGMGFWFVAKDAVTSTVTK